MVWKITGNKHKKSEKHLSIIKQKQVLESQPKLKSCLKTTNDIYDVFEHHDSSNDSSRFQHDPNSSKVQEQSSKYGGSRSRSSRSLGSKGSNLSVESKGSGNSSSVHANSKRVASVDVHSVSSRSWDRESRKSETAQSTQTSERSSADSRSQLEEKKKSVHFTMIQIRDYERVVGDNPSCTIGPPVGIGWNYGKTRVIDINSFEAVRPYRKSPSHLILSREEREALLLNWGASFHDIIEAVRSNLKIKNQRRQTVTNLGKVERIEEAFESATRKLKSALMLRRSTGNKVKRLQEQANLAQSALKSLKIAEDRALSEMRVTRRVPIVEKPKSKEDLKSFAMSNFGPSSPENAEGRPVHLIIPEKDDHAGSSKGHSLTGNSTTQSELEIERFYRELELEMFGDEELPSMVGQTLEVPLKNGDKNHLCSDGTDLRLEYASVNSGMSNKHSRDDLDDVMLEKERNRSMISQYLLEDADNESPKLDHTSYEYGEQDDIRHYYAAQSTQPVHRDQVSRNHPAWKSCSSSESPNLSRTRESTKAMEYQEPYHRQQQTIPLHAGMTMFEDCALLGGQSDTSSYREKKRHSSRSKDLNAGPKVQFIPPPTHLSPSHWMDDSDSPFIPYRGHDTITICEDNFGGRRQNGDRDRNAYNNVVFCPNFY